MPHTPSRFQKHRFLALGARFRSVWPEAAALAGLLIALGCGESPSGGGSTTLPTSGDPDGPTRLVATIPPVAALLAPMLGPGVEVATLVPAGRSVHGYRCGPEQLASVARADALVGVGLGIDTELGAPIDHARRTGRLILLSEVLGLDPSLFGDHHDHDHEGAHGDGAAIDPEALDPHLWLDPRLAARAVEPLAMSLPPGAGATHERAHAWRERIEAFDEEASGALEPHRGTPVITHHRAWVRVLERWGLEVVAVLRPIDTAEPTPAEIAAAVRAVDEHDARLVIAEPQLPQPAARRLADRAGIPVAILDPLGEGEYIALMRRNLRELLEGLEASGGGTAGPSRRMSGSPAR